MMNVYYCGDSWLHDYSRVRTAREEKYTHTHTRTHTENALDNSIVVLNFFGQFLVNSIEVTFDESIYKAANNFWIQ